MSPLCALTAAALSASVLGPCWGAATLSLMLALLAILPGAVRLSTGITVAAACGLALGAVASWLSHAPPPDFAPGRFRVEAEVRGSRCAEEGCSAHIQVQRAQPLTADAPTVGGFAARVWADTAWVPGEQMQALVGLGPPSRFLNPGLDPSFAPSDGAVGSVLGHGAARVRVPAYPRRWIEAARAHVRRALHQTTAPRAVGAARALVLGESGALAEGQRTAVRAAGLAHLVAVSGLHMALLAGLWYRLTVWLVRRTRWVLRWPANHWGAAVGLCMLPWAVMFAGAAPSALRAGLTAALGWLVTLRGRRPDPVGLCAVAVLLCLAFDPTLCRSPGFVLSVAAAAGLSRGAQRDLDTSRPGAVRESLRASGRTWLATLPIALAAFGWSSPWGLVSNLVAVPFASLVWVPLALTHALGASLHTALGAVTAAPFELACDLVMGLCERLPAAFGTGQSTALGRPVFGCLLLASSVWLWGGHSRARHLVALSLVGAAVLTQRLLHPGLAEGEVEVVFLDVGQGDAAVIRTGSGQVAMVDVGGRVAGRGPDPTLRAVVPWLAAHGIERLDLVVLSHPHPDHVGGLPALLRSVQVEEIWDTGQAVDEEPEGRIAGWLARARAGGVRVRQPGDLCGRKPFELGAEARLKVLAPCPAHDPGHGPNDNSFVVELAVGERRVLFPGDAELAQETGLLGHPSLRHVDILKVGHHGSRTSSHEPWLQRLSPRVAVISCGRRNLFGHPHEDALSRLQSLVPHVLRIDELGGVRVWTDGHALRIDAHAPGLDLRFPDGPGPGPRPPPR